MVSLRRLFLDLFGRGGLRQGVDIDDHFLPPFSEHLFVVLPHLLFGDADALVLAVDALADPRAPDPRVEAFAVVLHAGGFRAVAAPRVEDGALALDRLVLGSKSVRVFFNRLLEHLLANVARVVGVVAVLAVTARPAGHVLGKTLAVQLEALAGLAATGPGRDLLSLADSLL